ncbi:dipeptidase [Alkalihalobacillus sp. MEB130]|uniref:dipeptidase n=1 Tax=Alkalihalobacillus sp. MEB130 TaxID=2976704 RepID=UPI0028DF2D94|nr:membrane dipeptidase [Alkalihalobacillus sp. MEB130]MDT8860730.1 dipeptidase [Alkalihalobacillus sp. MEB130]
MKAKKYDGFESFNYLEAGKDYKLFELDKSEYLNSYYDLTREDQERVNTIFEKNLIISMRDHGFIVPKRKEDIIPYCRQPYTHFHYEGLARAGVDVIFENFMDGISIISSTEGLKWDDIIWTLGIRYCDIAKQDSVFIASSISDLKKAKRQGKVALIPSLEAASALENELGRVDLLYGFGVRCMGITYNHANTLGSGLAEVRDGGLTKFGNRVIERMNKLGMMVDISHCGDVTSIDVIEQSEKPVFITHGGARSLWNTPRMVPDHILKACAETGGVIGICAAPNTTLTKSRSEHTIDSVMEHFEYIVNLVGIDHVGFGPDTFYGDHVALQHEFDNMLAISDSHTGEEKFRESDYVKGLENPSESMINIVKWLVRKGYSNADIKKVTGANALRAIKQTFEN